MNSYRALIIITLLNFLISFNQIAGAQCSQQISVTDLKISEPNQEGSFRLTVRSGSDYSGELIKIDGINEQFVEKFESGVGARHQFSGLDVTGDAIYRVVLVFKDEDHFLCKRKVIDIEFANLQ